MQLQQKANWNAHMCKITQEIQTILKVLNRNTQTYLRATILSIEISTSMLTNIQHVGTMCGMLVQCTFCEFKH